MIRSPQSFMPEKTEWPDRLDRRHSIAQLLETPSISQFEGPAPAEIFYNCGAVLWNRGRATEAIEMIDAALKAKPDYPEALCLGGFILGKAGQTEAALRFYEQAIRYRPDFLVALANSGKLLFGLGRFAEALAAFDRSIAVAPGDADAWNNRAGALRELGRLEEALTASREALRLRPDFPEATLNGATLLMKLDRHEEALPAYMRARTLKPDFAEAPCGEGLTLQALGRFDEALAAFDAAIALGSADAVGNRGCLLLLMGDFAAGLEGYESRWLAGRSLKDALGVRFPAWTGQPVAGERLLVMNDHGFGDTIQFSRYALLAARRGAKVTFLCPGRLHRLFARFESVRCVHEIEASEAFDAQVALSSMPRAFGTRLDTIPAPIPYLEAEDALRAKWATRIGARGFKIGVSWQGNPNPEADIGRSFPLAMLAPLAALPGVRLISLQKGAGTEQLAGLPPGMTVETPGDDFDAGPDAFVDTAAAIAHLDLVVTCDTSIAHLAGALGAPVWVALKHVAEWRWLRDREDSPWYPTMRLFRQSRRGDWEELFARLAAAAAPLAAAALPPPPPPPAVAPAPVAAAPPAPPPVVEPAPVPVAATAPPALPPVVESAPAPVAAAAPPAPAPVVEPAPAPVAAAAPPAPAPVVEPAPSPVGSAPVAVARPAVVAAPRPSAPATSVPSRGGALPGVAIAIPGAIGELFDKITILEIKAERIADPLKLANVRNELSLLKALQASEGLRHPRLAELRASLKTVNASLWDVEDNIRLCEKKEDFGPDFVALARSVYRLNDERAALKLSINRLFNSAIVEEKSYA